MKNKKIFSKIMIWCINILIVIFGWTLCSFLITLSCTICNILGLLLTGILTGLVMMGFNKLINTKK